LGGEHPYYARNLSVLDEEIKFVTKKASSAKHGKLSLFQKIKKLFGKNVIFVIRMSSVTTTWPFP
jgi:hypothetical protein